MTDNNQDKKLLTHSKAGNKVFEEDNIFDHITDGDRVAILMAHFGTTHEDTREKTIDIINDMVTAHYPMIDMYEAYTSRIIVKRLKDRGVEKMLPSEALRLLADQGYTHVIVQPTTIIWGVEMESLCIDVEEIRDRFKEVRLCSPLLSYEEDYDALIEAMTAEAEEDEVYLWVGHGTYDVSTAQYAMLDYKLKDLGHPNHIIGCIEGYPYFEQALSQLRRLDTKRVHLQPLMLVAGEHAKNDIAEDWKEMLEEEGYEVVLHLCGLGELPAVQERFLELLTFYSRYRKIGIMQKKSLYISTGKKMK